MYIDVELSYKCLQCQSKLKPEFVTRDECIYKRCKKCGHEALHSKLTRTNFNDNKMWFSNKLEIEEF
jgi:DNA-directed RNA polymerase subunit RPC12/RpoP